MKANVISHKDACIWMTTFFSIKTILFGQCFAYENNRKKNGKKVVHDLFIRSQPLFIIALIPDFSVCKNSVFTFSPSRKTYSISLNKRVRALLYFHVFTVFTHRDNLDFKKTPVQDFNDCPSISTPTITSKKSTRSHYH